ncbi:MAG: hypothetical protein MUC34_09505 [Anaerolineae bacterium]|jgi:hypothetical protein|nr:hypothetical protein [Anaerolineae bacterium]
MAQRFVERARYRVRQFGWAVAAWWRKPDPQALAVAHRYLPEAGWLVFLRMPAVDQTHALKVLEAVRAAGCDDPALAQAALLHDAAKRLGGVTILHRVAVVLIKAFARDHWERLKARPAPARVSPLYPLWAHANHALTGAQLAEQVGCCEEAVELIRRHQDPLPPPDARAEQDALLAALQKADDDN